MQINARRHLAFLPLVVIGMFAGTASAQSVDTVVPLKGSPVRGKVVGMTRDKIAVDKDGQQVVIPANEIKYIVYAGEPGALRQIREAVRTGKLDRALRYVERFQTQNLDNPRSKADFQFYAAWVRLQKAIQSGEGMESAFKAMLQFVRQNPKSHHFYAAAEALGDLKVAQGAHQDSARYYTQLEKSPFPELQFRGAIRMAAAYRAQGGDQLAEALKRYEQIVAADVEGEEAQRQKQFALAGKASCQAEMGDAAAGIAALESLIAETDAKDTELLAVAYNALGDGYRAAGQNKDALLSYLHVDLLFPQQSQQRAEALHRIAGLWIALGRQDRADEARRTLQAEFAGSPWAKMGG